MTNMENVTKEDIKRGKLLIIIFCGTLVTVLTIFFGIFCFSHIHAYIYRNDVTIFSLGKYQNGEIYNGHYGKKNSNVEPVFDLIEFEIREKNNVDNSINTIQDKVSGIPKCHSYSIKLRVSFVNDDTVVDVDLYKFERQRITINNTYYFPSVSDSVDGKYKVMIIFNDTDGKFENYIEINNNYTTMCKVKENN